MAHSALNEEQRFWVYYAQRALALVESAEHKGRPLWEVSAVPKAAAVYAMRAVGELRRCLAGPTPWLRRRNLTNEATRFQDLKEWRAEIPVLADSFKNALYALAAEQGRGAAGNPKRKLGQSAIPERQYINRGLVELTQLAMSKGRDDWAQELLLPGNGNAPSRGRALLARYAIQLAENDGMKLSGTKLAEQIRERAKAPATHFNWFALRGHKWARKKAPPKRRLIGPAIARCD